MMLLTTMDCAVFQSGRLNEHVEGAALSQLQTKTVTAYFGELVSPPY
ncbi:hypothetical protein GBAR_LOCUS7250 [Geodia barretti]|uniref:Uncharacterized protein n=1 Tax=Geodia barretti TaxID=519541 RepID=A0AA35RJB3_GEOBA|nr:hypothetical protein GBAR_LOCUS7250 [Geodia barretti]